MISKVFRCFSWWGSSSYLGLVFLVPLLLPFHSLSMSYLQFSLLRGTVYCWSCGTQKCTVLPTSQLCSGPHMRQGVSEVPRSFSWRLDQRLRSPAAFKEESIGCCSLLAQMDSPRYFPPRLITLMARGWVKEFNVKMICYTSNIVWAQDSAKVFQGE